MRTQGTVLFRGEMYNLTHFAIIVIKSEQIKEDEMGGRYKYC